MRAGPLSDAKVIDLLNHYYVPIYISTDDFEDKNGPAPDAEKKEFVRLFGDVNEAKKGMGYVLTPEEKVIGNTSRMDRARKPSRPLNRALALNASNG